MTEQIKHRLTPEDFPELIDDFARRLSLNPTGSNNRYEIQRLIGKMQISFKMGEDGNVDIYASRKEEVENIEPPAKRVAIRKKQKYPMSIVPMWFFVYGRGMIGIPMNNSTMTTKWKNFCDTYKIHFEPSLEEHIFYKRSGTLTGITCNCFFFRTKAIEYYKNLFEMQEDGNFPLFPGTEMVLLPPEWLIWKKFAETTDYNKWDLLNSHIWNKLPMLGIVMEKYGKAYHFRPFYVYAARCFYKQPFNGNFNTNSQGNQLLGDIGLSGWYIKENLWQVRGSHLNDFLEKGATC